MPRSHLLPALGLLTFLLVDIALQLYIRLMPHDASQMLAGGSNVLFGDTAAVLGFVVAKTLWWFAHSVMPVLQQILSWCHLLSQALGTTVSWLFTLAAGLLLGWLTTKAGAWFSATSRDTYHLGRRQWHNNLPRFRENVELPVLGGVARCPFISLTGSLAEWAQEKVHRQLWKSGRAHLPPRLTCDDTYLVADALLFGAGDSIPEWVNLPEPYRGYGVTNSTTREQFHDLWQTRKRGWHQKMIRIDELIAGANGDAHSPLLVRAQQLAHELAQETDLYRDQLANVKNLLFRLRHPG